MPFAIFSSLSSRFLLNHSLQHKSRRRQTNTLRQCPLIYLGYRNKEKHFQLKVGLAVLTMLFVVLSSGET
jgi:hypothetical protein